MTGTIRLRVQATAALRNFDPANVRFGSKADTTRSPSNVRFAPESGHPIWAVNGALVCLRRRPVFEVGRFRCSRD
jgi:hypothetical protein